MHSPLPHESHAACGIAHEISSEREVQPKEWKTWTVEVEPWPEPVTGTVLLDELTQTLRRFVVLPPWAGETLALWTLHTYAFPLREVSAYIGIESPEKRCGKTTLLTVLSELAHRPVVATNISPSAFFRVIEETKPTLLIDEADTFLQGNEELKGILNAGYTQKTAYVVRVTHSPGGTQLARFSCWCPKVMAAIGRLPDTLADRCIVIRMQRKTTHETCDRFRDLDGTVLRQKCARFVRDHEPAIAQARPELPASLNDRASDIWEPLIVLADLAGGPWPEKARQAAIALSAGAQETQPIGVLLLDLLCLFTYEKTDRLFSRDLVAGLNLLADRPWMELCKGKAITELWLSQQLRPYGLRPRTIWCGALSAKGYEMTDFTEAFRRYIPQYEIQALLADTSTKKPIG